MNWQRETTCKWHTNLSKDKLRANETQTWGLQAHRTCPWRSHECKSWHAVSPGTPWWAALETIERTVPSLCRSKWSHWATVHAWSHCGTGGIPTLRSIATKHTMSRSLSSHTPKPLAFPSSLSHNVTRTHGKPSHKTN